MIDKAEKLLKEFSNDPNNVRLLNRFAKADQTDPEYIPEFVLKSLNLEIKNGIIAGDPYNIRELLVLKNRLS
ncbi:MAG: hypothetical protein KAQ64_05350 [Candidatus Pacebacteria bacterium]|nr:hypothetical protein [Candidatus Paceibacterota bacterium]